METVCTPRVTSAVVYGSPSADGKFRIVVTYTDGDQYITKTFRTRTFAGAKAFKADLFAGRITL